MSQKPKVLLWLDEWPDYRAYLEGTDVADRIEIVTASARETPEKGVLDAAEVVLAWDMPEGIIARMPKLRWVQAMTAGVDNWVARRDMGEGLTLTCARGIHKVQMPENILGALFHITKPFETARRQQERREWKRLTSDILAGKNAGIIGLGAIGGEVAAKLDGLGLRVLGINRSGAPVPHVQRVYKMDELTAFLGELDFLILLVPVTPTTADLINAASLAAMKPTAWLLNFGRGELVVDADLVAAVRNGVITGAVLDAFRTEPLPSDHPFWSTDGIVVLPHIGGRHPEKHKIVGDLFADNIRRFIAGDPLGGVVNLAAGY